MYKNTYIISLFLFCTISCTQLNEGVIIGKQFEPVHKIVHMQPMAIGKTTLLIPRTITIPDKWILVVEDRKQVPHRVEVTQHRYESLTIGQIWVRNDDTDIREEQ